MPNLTKHLTANESGQLLSNSTPQSSSHSVSNSLEGIGLEERMIIVDGRGGLKAKIQLMYQKAVYRPDESSSLHGSDIYARDPGGSKALEFLEQDVCLFPMKEIRAELVGEHSAMAPSILTQEKSW